MTERNYEPAFILDMSFDEALQRIAKTDPGEMPLRPERISKDKRPASAKNIRLGGKARRKRLNAGV